VRPGRPTPNEISELARQYDREYYHRYGEIDEPYVHDNPQWRRFFVRVADAIIAKLDPQTVLDAGCGIGLLVAALRERGVEAWGVDISEYAIAHAPDNVRPYCKVGSITEELDRRYDLIACIEVAEHLPEELADLAIANLTAHTDCVLFSSTPDHVEDPTHLNVKPAEYWLELFRRHDFVRDPTVDAGFVSEHAVCFQRISSRRENELHSMLADAQEQLLARDEALRSLRSLEIAERDDFIARQGEAIKWLEDVLSQRDQEIKWLRGVVGDKEAEAGSLRENIERAETDRRELERILNAVQSTKLWRLGQRYWRLRDRLRRMR
jgi:2-polyprenyl-3-methyl-5-hydroxy-6-metoxy-1,4-benzoquinol methylase